MFAEKRLNFSRVQGQEQTLAPGSWQLQPCAQEITPQSIGTQNGGSPVGGGPRQELEAEPLASRKQSQPIPTLLPAQVPPLEGGAVPSQYVQLPSLAKQ
jgi:hypothetical protein